MNRFMCPGNHDGGDGSAGNGMTNGILNWQVSSPRSSPSTEAHTSAWSGKLQPREVAWNAGRAKSVRYRNDR